MVFALSLVMLQTAVSFKQDLAQSVALWKAFEMPIPPDSALPEVSQDEKHKALLLLGMVERRKDGSYTLFSSVRTSNSALDGYSLSPWKIDKPLPRGFTVDSFELIHPNIFPENLVITTAVQCACIGHEKFAESLLSHMNPSDVRYDDEDYTWIGSPIDKSLTARTAFTIYVSYLNSLADGSIDRREILQKLIKLQKLHLIKKGPHHHLEPRTWGIEDHIKELQATLHQPNPKGDEIQAAVNELVNLEYPAGNILEWNDKPDDPILQKILSFRDRAIPYLANELDQPRLTRILVRSTGNNVTSIVPVSFVAQILIHSLAGDEVSIRGISQKKTVLDWYRAKNHGDMKTYLLSSLIEPIYRGYDYTSVGFRRLIYDYPDSLPQAIDKLRKYKVQCSFAFDDISKSKLPRDKKVSLILLGAKDNNLLSFTNTASALRRVDTNEADKLLLRFIQRIPKHFDLDWAEVAGYLFVATNPAVWQEFDNRIQAAEPDMKLALINAMSKIFAYNPKQPVSDESFRFLSRYFDDSTTLQTKNGKDYFRYWTFSKEPTLGEMALITAARLKNIEMPPRTTEKKEWWSELRKRVKRELN